MPYLDNNATTRPVPEAVEAARRGLESLWHNPSSVHRPGQEARHAVELARAELAALLGVPARQVTLTSGGTESIDLAIRGVLSTAAKPALVTTRVEHAAIRDLAEQLEKAGTAEVRWAPLAGGGVVDLDALGARLEGATLASVQWANNETGVVQAIEAIHGLCRSRGVLLHCDGVQWVGKLPISGPPPCDLLSFSAHKFHGPKGVGGLWARPGVRLRPTMPGAQELGRRGGTENVPGILGAGAAAAAARSWLADEGGRARLGALRDRFERGVIENCPGALVNGAACERLWNTSNIAFPRLEAEALLLAMSEKGLAASAGAACSSGSLEPSPVLLAMGVPPEAAHGSVRFSLSRFTTDAEIEEAIAIVAACVRRVGAGMTG